MRSFWSVENNIKLAHTVCHGVCFQQGRLRGGETCRKMAELRHQPDGRVQGPRLPRNGTGNEPELSSHLHQDAPYAGQPEETLGPAQGHPDLTLGCGASSVSRASRWEGSPSMLGQPWGGTPSHRTHRASGAWEMTSKPVAWLPRTLTLRGTRVLACLHAFQPSSLSPTIRAEVSALSPHCLCCFLPGSPSLTRIFSMSLTWVNNS